MRQPVKPSSDHHHDAFSLWLFVVTNVATFAGLAGLLRLVGPIDVWHSQFLAHGWQWIVVFVAFSLVNCFLEFFFHRYVLHRPVFKVLSYFYKTHTKHHNLTRISLRKAPNGKKLKFVENRFPITEPEQYESSFFPWYSLAIFALIQTPFLILCQWLLPNFPWFLGGYAALGSSLALYEIVHAIEHWPFERWAKLIEARWVGPIWAKAYAFHLRHHAAIECNESISGFFTIPVADLLFGTFILPHSLYVDGQSSNEQEFENPRPRAVIRWLDRLAKAAVRRRRVPIAEANPYEDPPTAEPSTSLGL